MHSVDRYYNCSTADCSSHHRVVHGQLLLEAVDLLLILPGQQLRVERYMYVRTCTCTCTRQGNAKQLHWKAATCTCMYVSRELCQAGLEPVTYCTCTAQLGR